VSLKKGKKETPVGILGAGRMGQIHAALIAATPGLRPAAVSSRSPELRQKVASRYAVRAYPTHEQLLEDPDFHWVVIATYTHQHKQWAAEALRRGKSLIIEKPVALNLGEAEEIFAAARKRGLQVTVHQNRRWDSDFQLVQKLIEEQRLGEVYRIESRYAGFSNDWAGWGAQGLENPWRLKEAYGGGMLNDWGPHLFDQLLLLAGREALSLFGRLEARVWSREVDDHFWAELLFAGGVSARVEASNNFRLPLPRWNILGNLGSLQVSGGGPEQWNSAVLRLDAADLSAARREKRYDIEQPELSEGFYSDFAAALRSGEPLPVQEDQILGVMRLMDAVRESNRRGEAVKP
jgi:scyllo-inositol 2-dehydrogenase (NADP+)